MKIDITSLCFGFKIKKDNDSGTPAWATSIGQAPAGVCYIDSKRDGLNDIIYGMMYKSHSDFENLKDHDVPGLEKREEPRGDRERMMFSVFEDVYVNDMKVDGIYTLSYEREDSPSHKNRLHICYAKYLTYNGHSNKTTLKKMASLLGCTEDACWFVTDIFIVNQSSLHFKAVVVNPNQSMSYENSKDRKKAWENILENNYTIVYGPTKYGTGTLNYPGLLRFAMQILAESNKLSQLFADENDYEIRDNKFVIGKCQVGWDKTSQRSLREDKFDDSFSWKYDNKDFILNKELTGISLLGFVDVFNKLCTNEYEIKTELDNESKQVFTIVKYLKNDGFTMNKKHQHYLCALKTKPFMLLAGISGTGKSRIVREMAKACWKEGDEEYGKNNPKNFCMVQVKPNWHDSSELIGYVSRINGEKYVVGPFLRFLAKAIKDENTPYFLCLDEMNLAPVEQYFAEYLSVIESRKLNADGSITTDPIIPYENTEAYGTLIDQLFADETDRKAYKSETDGKRLTIPQNLFVVGTVNMDETTFSFSRKVLDRAMTLEMNEVDLHGGLTDEGSEIGYIGNSIIGDAAEGKDVYADNKELCDKVIAYLNQVNNALEGTPFKIAYRTRNEFLLYAVNRQLLDKDSQLWQTLDEMTSMKILSRIEGDSERTKEPLNALKTLVEENILNQIPEPEVGKEKAKSITALKIKEMLEKLEKQGYTSYWT